MAWYRAGTATFTNSSTAVTGSGTAWATNVRPGDEIIGPDNISREVESVTSDTALVMVESYAGSTTSGAAYKVKPIQGWNRDVAARLAALINEYGSIEAALSVLAGKIGINTDAPLGTFHARQIASEIVAVLESSSTGNASVVQHRLAGSPGWEFGMTGDAASYAYRWCYGTFGTGTTKMALTSDGRLGLGTTTPAALLHVNGAVRLDVSVSGTNSGPGGAAALPSAPAGYAIINIGGLDRKIPYYP